MKVLLFFVFINTSDLKVRLFICKVKYFFTGLDSVYVCKLSLIKQLNDFPKNKKGEDE